VVLQEAAQVVSGSTSKMVLNDPSETLAKRSSFSREPEASSHNYSSSVTNQIMRDKDQTEIGRLQVQIKSQNYLISDINKEKEDLKYKVSTLEKEIDVIRGRHKNQLTLFEEQVSEQKHSIEKYKQMLDDHMARHSAELKELNRNSEKEKLDIKIENDKHVVYLKHQHREGQDLLQQAIKSLEEDKELKNKHIGTLALENDSLKEDVYQLELRLDKQVEVD
jgi:uncharacterized protein (DUF342 family)